MAWASPQWARSPLAGCVLRVDQARNLLLIQGTTSERQAALDVIASFDVEWLRNQSVGIYPLKSTAPETMIRELERVFETGEDGRGQGVIRFQPISRMNAVMVVTRNPKVLERGSVGAASRPLRCERHHGARLSPQVRECRAHRQNSQ